MPIGPAVSAVYSLGGQRILTASVHLANDQLFLRKLCGAGGTARLRVMCAHKAILCPMMNRAEIP